MLCKASMSTGATVDLLAPPLEAMAFFQALQLKFNKLLRLRSFKHTTCQTLQSCYPLSKKTAVGKMKLKGSAWPLGLALVWNWSLQSMILVWYWSMILIWYWSGIDLVLIWYWSGIDPGIGLILILILIWYWLDIEKWINPQDWKKQLLRLKKIKFNIIDQDWSGLIFFNPGSSGNMRRCEDEKMWR